MTVRVYRSTDPGAPVFSNAVGNLLGVLDACLVNGYGSGATAKAPLGWSIILTPAANMRSYKMGGGTQLGLVFDNSVATYYANVRAGMNLDSPNSANFLTAWNVAFWPTTDKAPVATWLLTDNTAGNRPWMLVGDEKGFIFFNQHNNTNALTTDTWAMNMFGDFTPYNPSETGNCYLAHDTVTSTVQAFNSSLVNANGKWAAKEFTGHGLGVPVRLQVDPWCDYAARNFGNPALYAPAPNPNTNNFDMSRVYVVSNYYNSARGHLRGLWCPLHQVNQGNGMNAAGFQNGDQITIAGPTGKRVLEYRRIGTYAQYCCFVEVSNTWDQ